MKIFDRIFITVIGENKKKIEEKIDREYDPVGALTEANRGFSLDNNPDIQLSGTVKTYAATIVNRLKSTDQKKEEYKEAISLLKKGYAIRDVAKLTGKGVSTIQRVKKEFC